MATITMEFPITEMLSIQIGDVAYYSTPTELGSFQNASGLQEIGNITNITQGQTTLSVTCSVPANTTPPTNTDFIFFAKNL